MWKLGGVASFPSKERVEECNNENRHKGNTNESTSSLEVGNQAQSPLW